jgi:hypothetical protein
MLIGGGVTALIFGSLGNHSVLGRAVELTAGVVFLVRGVLFARSSRLD